MLPQILSGHREGENNHDDNALARRFSLRLEPRASYSSCLGQILLLVHCALLPILPKRGTQNTSRDRSVPETTGCSGRNAAVLPRPATTWWPTFVWPESRRRMDGQTLSRRGRSGRAAIAHPSFGCPRCAADAMTASKAGINASPQPAPASASLA